MSHLPTAQTEEVPGEGVGSKYNFAVGAMRIKNIKIGPFKPEEKPKFSMRKTGVDPPKSFVCFTDRFERDDGFIMVFMVQNYGVKEVKITIRRTA